MDEKFDKSMAIDAAKELGKIIVSADLCTLSCGLIRLVLPPQVNIAVTGAMILGGNLIGWFMGDKVGDFVSDQIGETIELLESRAKRIKRSADVILDKDLKEETTKE